MAGEQPFTEEGMDFAFYDAKVSSVDMSELSGTEMDETEGAAGEYQVLNSLTGLGFSTGTYLVTSPSPSWQGFPNSAGSGALSGAMAPTPMSAATLGATAGAMNAAADTGSNPMPSYGQQH